jgi:hypothetical protein
VAAVRAGVEARIVGGDLTPTLGAAELLAALDRSAHPG